MLLLPDLSSPLLPHFAHRRHLLVLLTPLLEHVGQ